MTERIVIDTNVVASGLRSRRGASFHLLRLIGLGYFQPCVSVPLVFEYEDVLSRPSLALPPSAVQTILDYLCAESHRQEIHYLWRPCLNDPKDDLVLEVAVASQSSTIVTFNRSDFAKIEKFGLKARTPGEFLKHLGVKI